MHPGHLSASPLAQPRALTIHLDVRAGGRDYRLQELLQLIVKPERKLESGRLATARHLVLLGRLHAHLHKLLQRARQAYATQQTWLEGSTAQENVLAEYLKVVVLLDMCAGLALRVAQSATGVEAAVLMAVALDAIRYALVQIALDIDVLRALVLQAPVGRESEAIYLHLAHSQRLRLHLLQPEYVLHDAESVLQALLSIGRAVRYAEYI